MPKIDFGVDFGRAEWLFILLVYATAGPNTALEVFILLGAGLGILLTGWIRIRKN